MFDMGSKEFTGFSDAHFDAFDERKWSSHRFNLERMAADSALTALRKNLEPRLPGLGTAFQWEKTGSHPSISNGNKVDGLWQYLQRPEAEMKAIIQMVDREVSLQAKINDPSSIHAFAFSGLRLDATGLSLGFWLHGKAILDRRNLLAAAADPIDRGRLPYIMSLLSPEARVLVDGEPRSLDAWAEPAALDKLQGWCCVICALPRDDHRIRTGDHLDALAEMFQPFTELLSYAAWTSANDRLKLGRQLKAERKEKTRKSVGFQNGDDVKIIEGLLTGKQGKVMGVDAKGRIKVKMGHLTIDMNPSTLKKV